MWFSTYGILVPPVEMSRPVPTAPTAEKELRNHGSSQKSGVLFVRSEGKFCAADACVTARRVPPGQLVVRGKNDHVTSSPTLMPWRVLLLCWIEIYPSRQRLI